MFLDKSIHIRISFIHDRIHLRLDRHRNDFLDTQIGGDGIETLADLYPNELDLFVEDDDFDPIQLLENIEAGRPGDLTLDELEALDSYTGEGYNELNRELNAEESRTAQGYEADPLPPRLQERRDDLDSALDKIGGKDWGFDDAIVYRGKGFDNEADYRARIERLTSGTYTNAGFLSTSIELEDAEGFYRSFDTHRILIVIEDAFGGVDVAPYSQNPNEDEILFPIGTRFRFVSSEETIIEPTSPQGSRVFVTRIILRQLF